MQVIRYLTPKLKRKEKALLILLYFTIFMWHLIIKKVMFDSRKVPKKEK